MTSRRSRPWKRSRPPHPRPPRVEGGNMPRLLRTVARTAAIAGTASAVSGRGQPRQARKWGADDGQAGPPPGAAFSEPDQHIPAKPSAPSTADTLEQLKSLGE